jgi:hypothetical protein
VVGLLGLDVSGGLGLGLSRGGGSPDFRIPGFPDLVGFVLSFYPGMLVIPGVFLCTIFSL